ncbi:MAG: heparan-alpha-glucosaminide N-acetyltransferase domain-containing protein [Vicinamibacterales bacterium]
MQSTTVRGQIAATPAVTSPVAPAAGVRIHSIDVLRGIVMVLMALDHVRDYFTIARFDPLDLSQTTPALFATRWITHFCAPVFMLLAGTSAYLLGRKRSPADLSRFLLTRGLWLVVLEFTVVAFAWTFNFRYPLGFTLLVIWALGVSMVSLAALVYLPLRWIAVVGLLLIAGHNAFDGVRPESFGVWAPLWNVLHVPILLPQALVQYPLIPWIGVMAAGYVLGTVYEMDRRPRRQYFVALGSGAIILFITLRAGNVYGDPLPWSPQASGLLSAMSFVNTQKYPPSLLYLLMTLGPALILLAVLEYARGTWATIAETFGRVPFLFYVAHIVLAHLAAGIIALATGHGLEILTNVFVFYPRDWGFGLPVVYVAWLLVVAALYPACRRFAEVKRRRRDWWLSYV